LSKTRRGSKQEAPKIVTPIKVNRKLKGDGPRRGLGHNNRAVGHDARREGRKKTGLAPVEKQARGLPVGDLQEREGNSMGKKSGREKEMVGKKEQVVSYWE